MAALWHLERLCSLFLLHEERIKTEKEKRKEPAYTSVGFRNWKKAPKCCKDHQNSKCHKEAATLAVIIYGQTGLV